MTTIELTPASIQSDIEGYDKRLEAVKAKLRDLPDRGIKASQEMGVQSNGDNG